MTVRRGPQAFDLPPGRRIGKHYEVVERLGEGTEGEVYRVVERETGIQRAVKLYHPQPRSRRDLGVWHARKLHQLRGCVIVLQYSHTEVVSIGRKPIRCLVSELLDGFVLETWIQAQRGGRLPAYLALNTLHQLARGLEEVHGMNEYHGDVHSRNIIVRPRGVHLNLKLVDFYDWGRSARRKQEQDVVDAVRVFHEALGGASAYRHLRPEMKQICLGLKPSLILRRYPTMSALRLHLESFEWERL